MPISRIKTGAIIDDAVTSAKIADDAVTTALIADDAVTTALIADDAVTTAKVDTNIDIAGTLDVTGATTLDDGLTVDNDGATVLTVDRATSDGTIIDVQKDGTTVGSIGAVADKIYIGSSAGGDTFLRLNSNTVTPASSSGADRDAVINLGYSSGRFQNLFLSGGVYLGGTGSANYLDDYEEGSWTPNIGGNATYTNAQGTYTKIGNSVCGAFDITINALGTGSTTTLFGFPFTASLGALGVNSGHVSFYTGLSNNVYSLDMYIIANTTSAYFTGHTTASGNIANSIGVWQNGTRILGTVHYQAA